ncbi:Hypothetical protein HDN1F_15080 [gamma proteobacterium HdN1]|nr:Hypothetical protein HDN1F_15080 [gamma proteobacterium HdN1]
MSRTATGKLPEPAETIIAKLQELAVRHHVEFEGNTQSGYARGKGFHIRYEIEGEIATVTVTKKPILVPWSVVERALAKLF